MTQQSHAIRPVPADQSDATVQVRIGQDRFTARWRTDIAPAACARLRELLPLKGKLIHARWSGEACWLPLGDRGLYLPAEPVIHAPAPGDILLYPGGISETEILIPYGPTRFACAAGPLAGHPVLSIDDDLDRLAALGRDILRRGARPFEISLLPPARLPAPATNQPGDKP